MNIKIAYDDVVQSIQDVEKMMIEEYEKWIEWQNLPHVDAEEMILHSLTAYQRWYVSSFIIRWDSMREEEEARRA